MSGVEFVSSPLLPIPHGCFTREGGVSAPPFDSLNIKMVGDDPQHVATNRRLACEALRVPTERLVFLRLTHGDQILIAGEGQAGQDFDDYDAAITNVPGLPLGFGVADCLPIWIYDPIQQAVGIAHAGWRGTVAEIGPKTVQAMSAQYGSQPSDLRVAIGPGIALESFEVGDEVANQFDDRFKSQIDGRWHVDLRAAISQQLQQVGVTQIDQLAINTFTDQRFFSHRRQAPTGRNLAVICLS